MAIVRAQAPYSSGCGGGYSRKTISVTPGETITFVVGSGGSGVNVSGGASIVYRGTVSDTEIFRATGGSSGGGGGGTGINGDVNYSGGSNYYSVGPGSGPYRDYIYGGNSGSPTGSGLPRGSGSNYSANPPPTDAGAGGVSYNDGSNFFPFILSNPTIPGGGSGGYNSISGAGGQIRVTF